MRPLNVVLALMSIGFAACSSSPSADGAGGPGGAGNGGGGNNNGNPSVDGGSHHSGGGGSSDGGTPNGGGDATIDPPGTGDDDSGNPPPPPDTDADPNDPSCSAWKVGTLTGYNNSDSADDPNSGSVMEFTGLTSAFYDNVAIASVDMSDWPSDQYHWVDINYNGKIGRVGVWDACLNSDCPDGTSCCTDNKQKFANPGYLLDVETRTAKRLWGVTDAENTLQDKIQYRVCGSFDPDAIASQYGATRN